MFEDPYCTLIVPRWCGVVGLFVGQSAAVFIKSQFVGRANEVLNFGHGVGFVGRAVELLKRGAWPRHDST